jgi:hypothetical protein
VYVSIFGVVPTCDKERWNYLKIIVSKLLISFAPNPPGYSHTAMTDYSDEQQAPEVQCA